MKRNLVVALVVVALAGTAACAVNLGEILLKTVATGVIVNAVAKPADKAINTLLVNRNLPCGTATKVVPALSVGEKGYVGMAQVAGPQGLVNDAKSVVQYETSFLDKQYRIKLLMPMNSVNPVGVSRVKGIGVSALIDMALSSNAYDLPPSEGWNLGDVLKAGVIGYAASQYGPQINSFINKAYQSEGGLPEGVTKVVPYLSFGSKAYIGMMQVSGPARQVDQVKAVWQFEQLFDRGRIRLRALVPTDSINPLKLHRVKGVGCTAVIDAMLLRAKDEERHPDHYHYFQHSPVFVGANEDPRYHRPRGWDRGEKVGWVRHGNPNLPPGPEQTAGAIRTPLQYPGQHPAIIDAGLWQQVQAQLLAAKARPRGRSIGATQARVLTGKLREDSGGVLTPTHTQRHGRRFAYYVSHRLIAKGTDPTGWRLPADALEATIRNLLSAHLRRSAERHALLAAPDVTQAASLAQRAQDLAARIEVEQDLVGSMIANIDLALGRVQIHLAVAPLAAVLGVAAQDLAADLVTFVRPFTLRRRGNETRIVSGEVVPSPDHILLRSLSEARGWAKALRAGTSLAGIAAGTGRSVPYIRTRLPLALLAPRLQAAILDGRQPPDLSLARLIRDGIPVDWAEQERCFGLG